MEAPSASSIHQSSDVSNSSGSTSISADEIALYDRQIRLWGVQAQEKIRTAKILLIGLQGLGNEIAKNLILAGIGSVTVVDDQTVTEDDLGSQFLVGEEHVGMNRAVAALPQLQKLNPRVSLQITTMAVLLEDPTLFGTVTLVIATDLPLSIFSTINAACRLENRPFYAAGTFGMYGFIFADLIIHTYVIEREASNIPIKLGSESSTRTVAAAQKRKEPGGKTTELITKTETYTPILLANTSQLPPQQLNSRRKKFAITPVLSCLRALWEFQGLTQRLIPSTTLKADLELFTTLATTKHKELSLPHETLNSAVLRSFLQNLGAELSPVCALLGGQVAQDVVNVISGKEQPIQNFVIFDGEETKAPVYTLHTDLSIMNGVMPPAPLVDGEVLSNGAGNGVNTAAFADGVPPVQAIATNDILTTYRDGTGTGIRQISNGAQNPGASAS